MEEKDISERANQVANSIRPFINSTDNDEVVKAISFEIQRAINEKAIELTGALSSILNISEDIGREGCTYGDTEHDSLSAAYGFNVCLEYVKNIAYKSLKQPTH